MKARLTIQVEFPDKFRDMAKTLVPETALNGLGAGIAAFKVNGVSYAEREVQRNQKRAK